MTTLPKFTAFKSELTDEEVTKLEADANKPKESKFFKPGNYDLEVISAELDKQNLSDPTWFNYKITLGRDGKSIRTLAIVPTSGPKYNRPGKEPTMFLYFKILELVRGLGEDADQKNIAKTLSGLFKNPSDLVGRVLNVDVGYPGYYVEYVGKDADNKNQYKIFERSGKEFKGDGEAELVYSDRDSAIADAANYRIEIKKYVEVLKIHPGKKEESDDSDPWE